MNEKKITKPVLSLHHAQFSTLVRKPITFRWEGQIDHICHRPHFVRPKSGPGITSVKDTKTTNDTAIVKSKFQSVFLI